MEIQNYKLEFLLFKEVEQTIVDGEITEEQIHLHVIASNSLTDALNLT